MRLKSQQGFTLIEMGFVMILWGGIMALLFSIYTQYRNRIVLIETQERLQLNAEAVASFSNDPKFYPCPSMPALQPTHPDYGKAICPTLGALPIGTCDKGLCRVAAARDVDGNPLTVDTVLIGGIPFIDMQDKALKQGISSVNAARRRGIYDGWGGAFTYAVSENLTKNDFTFDNNQGGISVVTEWGTSIVEPFGSADFVIISHGQDRRGAYTQEHLLGTLCVGAGRDISNCLHDDAEFVNSLIYKRAGASFFDDYVYVYQASVDGVWAEEGADMYYKGTGNVGVGIDLPIERLHVDGRVYGDSVRSNNLCDATDADCFHPKILGGTLTRSGGAVVRDSDGVSDGMGCDDVNHVATGIENNGMRCGAPGYTMDQGRNVSCPGEFLKGFNSDGSPICRLTP